MMTKKKGKKSGRGPPSTNDDAADPTGETAMLLSRAASGDDGQGTKRTSASGLCAFWELVTGKSITQHDQRQVATNSEQSPGSASYPANVERPPKIKAPSTVDKPPHVDDADSSKNNGHYPVGSEQTSAVHETPPQVADAAEGVETSSQPHDDAIEECRRCQSELAAERNKSESLQAVIARLETDAQAARAGLEPVQLEKGKVDAELLWARAELGHLKTTKEKLAVELEGLSHELGTLRQAKTELEKQLKAMTADRNSLKTDLEVATARLAMLRDVKIDLDREVETKALVIMQLTERAASHKAKAASAVSDLQPAIASLEEKLAVEKRRAMVAVSVSAKLEVLLKQAEEDLDAHTDKLGRLESYQVALQDEPKGKYGQILDAIWTSVFTLVTSTFVQDLAIKCLADPTAWATLHQSPYLSLGHSSCTVLPLPLSNTAAAKHMRLTAMLAIVARVLANHVFRPVHLLDHASHDAALAHFLRNMHAIDPAREAFYRATLLGMALSGGGHAGGSGARRASREVARLAQPLLAAAQYDAFVNRLDHVCDEAARLWRTVQLARVPVEPYFGPPYETFEWQVLALPQLDNMEVEVRRGPRDEDAVDMQTLSSGAALNDIVLVAWPTFRVVDKTGSASLTRGLVLTKRQMRPALEEVRRRPGVGSRAKMVRTRSMPGKLPERSNSMRFSLGAKQAEKDACGPHG